MDTVTIVYKTASPGFCGGLYIEYDKVSNRYFNGIDSKEEQLNFIVSDLENGYVIHTEEEQIFRDLLDCIPDTNYTKQYKVVACAGRYWIFPECVPCEQEMPFISTDIKPRTVRNDTLEGMFPQGHETISLISSFERVDRIYRPIKELLQPDQCYWCPTGHWSRYETVIKPNSAFTLFNEGVKRDIRYIHRSDKGWTPVAEGLFVAMPVDTFINPLHREEGTGLSYASFWCRSDDPPEIMCTNINGIKEKLNES